MKSILLAFVLVAAPAFAQDAFDLRTAEIVNAPDVSQWPQRTTITGLSFDGSTTRVSFTKQDGPDRWPDITPAGWSGPLQYTIWLCLQNGGQWACSAFVQMWHGRDGTGSPQDPDVPSLYHRNWYYDRRWSPLYGHPIQQSEPIGMFVTSGNARDNVGPMSVQERSNVVVIPATDRGSFSFGAPVVVPPPPVVQPPPVVVPPVVPPVVQPPPIADTSALERQIAELRADVDAGRAENQAFFEHVGIQWKAILTWTAKYIAPVVAGIIGGLKLPH